MARQPFKTTVFGIIVLGAISSWIANQFGFINLGQLFGGGSNAQGSTQARIVTIVNGPQLGTSKPGPMRTPSPAPAPEHEASLVSQPPNSPSQPQLPHDRVAEPVTAQLVQQSQPAPVQKLVTAPEITDIPLQASTSIFWQDLRASVVRMRNYNGLTAVTFKVDGSSNSDPYRWIPAPIETAMHDFYTANTNIIDQNGHRYRLVGDNPDVAEQPRYNNGNYVLAPHETVFVTYLFEPLDSAARKLNITFPEIIKDGNLDVGRVTIHVTLQ